MSALYHNEQNWEDFVVPTMHYNKILFILLEYNKLSSNYGFTICCEVPVNLEYTDVYLREYTNKYAKK